MEGEEIAVKKEQKNEKDTIEIKLPNFTSKVRKNPWILSTLILALVVITLIFTGYSSRVSG